MPRRGATRQSSDFEVASSNMANVTMTEEQFTTLLNRFQQFSSMDRQSDTVKCGNFTKCTSRFNGSEDSEVETFIDSVEVYKDCVNISDDNALKGLSILLTGLAATWWLGVKTNFKTWKEAIEALRITFGKKKPPHQIYRELFATEQSDDTKTDIFVCKSRALLAEIPDELSEKIKLDMVYGLLHRKIRKRLLREQVQTFSDLLLQARAIENSLLEGSKKKSFAISEDVNVTEKRKKKLCAYCKKVGHAKDECNLLRKKQERKEGTSPLVEQTGPYTTKTFISCYGCGEPGVIRAKCPNCTKRPMSTERNSASGSSTIRSVQFFSIASSSGPQPQRPSLAVRINGRDGNAIADSGAQISIAGYTLYQLMKMDRIPFKRKKLMVAFADAVPHEEYVDEAQVFVELGDRSIPISLVAIPRLKNNFTLLGIDFLERAKIVLNPSTRTLNFLDQPNVIHEYTNPITDISQVSESRFSEDNILHSDEASSVSNIQQSQLNKLLAEDSDVFRPGGVATTFVEHCTAGLLQTPVHKRPFEVLSVDLFGPLPTTQNGNRWIFIVEDIATGWIELFSLAEVTAVKCSKILLDEVFLRYGTPRKLICDNGVQFVGEVMQQTCYLLGVEYSLISSCHIQSNPGERKNYDLKSQLVIHVGKEHTTWDEKLPSIRFSMNSANFGHILTEAKERLNAFG